jgi:hypothetical protein
LEEVQAVSHDALRTIPGAGRAVIESIGQVRELDPEVLRAAVARPHRREPSRLDVVLQAMTPATRLRYGHLAAPMAGGSLSERALLEIVEAFNAEPLPSADPRVVAHLEQAGHVDLVATYVQTHRPIDQGEAQR